MLIKIWEEKSLLILNGSKKGKEKKKEQPTRKRIFSQNSENPEPSYDKVKHFYWQDYTKAILNPSRLLRELKTHPEDKARERSYFEGAVAAARVSAGLVSPKTLSVWQ